VAIGTDSWTQVGWAVFSRVSGMCHRSTLLNLAYVGSSVVLAAKGALISSPRNRTNTDVLMGFNSLSRVSLDYHNDFLRSGSSYPYYQLITELPRSLEVLEILNAHGPDEHIIKLASRCCPDLTELRLGRCTMFNNRNCVWWKAHPADHDAYMADRGVEAYAVSRTFFGNSEKIILTPNTLGCCWKPH
jgi:hypothetical protein